LADDEFCSNTNAEAPDSYNLMVCPNDADLCGDKLIEVAAADSGVSVEMSSLPVGQVCTYVISPAADFTEDYSLTFSKASNVAIDVYSHTPTVAGTPEFVYTADAVEQTTIDLTSAESQEVAVTAGQVLYVSVLASADAGEFQF